jgi:hypothetical protein
MVAAAVDTFNGTMTRRRRRRLMMTTAMDIITTVVVETGNRPDRRRDADDWNGWRI